MCMIFSWKMMDRFTSRGKQGVMVRVQWISLSSSMISLEIRSGIWNVTWGDAFDQKGYSLSIDGESNSLFVAGNTKLSGFGFDALLLQIDTCSGTIFSEFLVWGGNIDDHGRGVLVTSGPFIYFSGTTSSMGSGSTDSFLCKIINNAPPVISEPPDLSYMFDSLGNEIAWIIVDNTSISVPEFDLLIDNEIVDHSSWKSGIPVERNLDGLAVGSHNITIIASDGYTGVSQDEVNVTVSALDNPGEYTIIVDVVSVVAIIGVAIALMTFKLKKQNGR